VGPSSTLDDGVPPSDSSAPHQGRMLGVLAIVLTILLLASNAAWGIMYLMTQGSAPVSQATTPQTNNNSTTANNTGYRNMPEIGAKFGLDNDTAKITYAYIHNNNGTYIGLSTVPLTDKNVPRSLTTYDCTSGNGPIGRLQILQPSDTYNGQTVPQLVAAGKAKQIKNIYIMYTSPDTKCSDDPTVNAIADSGVPIAKKLFATLVAQ